MEDCIKNSSLIYEKFFSSLLYKKKKKRINTRYIQTIMANWASKKQQLWKRLNWKRLMSDWNNSTFWCFHHWEGSSTCFCRELNDIPWMVNLGKNKLSMLNSASLFFSLKWAALRGVYLLYYSMNIACD